MSSDYLRWRPHPWHGLETGPNPPSSVTVFVEITPFDHIKYEVDKHSGFLKVDRPQLSSSRPPTVYGFIPRTLCGARVGRLMEGAVSGPVYGRQQAEKVVFAAMSDYAEKYAD